MKNIFFFTFLGVMHCFGQLAKVEKISSNIALYDQYVETDEFGYHYFIKNNVLIKVQNSENFEYKNIALGKISRIDLHNPLKIVLFYEDFNTVVLLDNQLNESNVINFSTYDQSVITTACGMASQNRLWIFNSLSQKIGLFDILNNSFSEITPPQQTTKKIYDSNFNTFYWIDTNNMISSCDVFGKIASIGKITSFDKIQLLNDESVIYLKSNQLFYNDLKANKTDLIDILEKTIENFSYKNQILTIFTNQELHTYKFKKI